MTTNDYQNKPCPFCGETTYTWGIMDSNGRPVFKSRDENLAERIFAPRETVQARHCDTCSNLQLFVSYKPKS